MIPLAFAQSNKILESTSERISVTEQEDQKNKEIEKLHKAPLRQIRDDGIAQEDVKCNEGKVLFFKWTHKVPRTSPVCIFETSIDKLDNTFVAWTSKGNSNYVDYVDHQYLNEKNSNLKRTTVVNYALDSQNNNIVFNITEQIIKQDTDFVIHNMVIDNKPTLKYFHDQSEPRPFFDYHPSETNIPAGPESSPFVDTKPSPEPGFFYNQHEVYFDILDDKGNNAVDWGDPRTSIHASGIVDEAYRYGPTDRCGDDYVGWFLTLHLESTFKILGGVDAVTLHHPDRILVNYSDSNSTEFSDTFWSQDKTEFVFGNGLEKIDIIEIPCISEFGNTSHFYEITMEIVE